jgi:hypothetical protein
MAVTNPYIFLLNPMVCRAMKNKGFACLPCLLMVSAKPTDVDSAIKKPVAPEPNYFVENVSHDSSN